VGALVAEAERTPREQEAERRRRVADAVDALLRKREKRDENGADARTRGPPAATPCPM
jgi:hypothetical protein